MKKNLSLLLSIFVVLLIIDWILGAAQAAGAIPLWTFLIPNLPFGLAYVFMESHWAGTHYLIFGHRLGDIGSLIVFLSVVLAQSALYFFLIKAFLRAKRWRIQVS